MHGAMSEPCTAYLAWKLDRGSQTSDHLQMILKTSQMLNLNMELLDHYIGSLKIFWEKCGYSALRQYGLAQWILICWVRYFGHEMDLTYFLLGRLGITRKSEIAIHGPVRALYIADIWVETTDENEIFTLVCNFTTEKMGIISIKSSLTSLNAECEKIA